jgi:hypothetical protein
LVINSTNSQKRRVILVVTVACLILGLVAFGYGILREAPKRIARIRCAGSDQTVRIGEIVHLVGNHPSRNSGRADPNGKNLSYSWRLQFLDYPNDSGTNLSNSTGPETSFIADVAGTFEATLVVKDVTSPFLYCRTPDKVKILVKD